MAKSRQTKKASPCEKTVCPSPEELSVIANNVKCEQCGLMFRNWPCYRFHNVRVHQHKNLARTVKGNVHYHCPVRTCIYTVNSQRYFSSMKYLKQVREEELVFINHLLHLHICRSSQVDVAGVVATNFVVHNFFFPFLLSMT